MNFKIFKIVWVFILTSLMAFRLTAQIPVEVFAGHQKATLDLMFFRYFKSSEGKASRWLFFNRNRASIDYAMTSASNLPQFGFTEAISYNAPQLKGFAPVAVVTLLNRGVYPKAGIQWARIRSKLTLFGWVVAETFRQPTTDAFFLARFTPKLTHKTKLYSQLEVLHGIPARKTENLSFTQRLRLGIDRQQWQTGLGIDLTEIGRRQFATSQNIGIFIRHDF